MARSLDRGLVALALGLYSVPSFVLIPLIWMANLAIFRAGYPNLPQAGWGTPSHVVLPVLVLAAANVGYITQLTRSSMLEVLRDDFVRTARAKGLIERTVIVRHVLRNALLPLITLLGPTTAFLVTGAFVVEVLFNIPGIGRISVEAVGRRDYPVIQGTTIMLGIAVVIMNLIERYALPCVRPAHSADRVGDRDREQCNSTIFAAYTLYPVHMDTNTDNAQQILDSETTRPCAMSGIHLASFGAWRAAELRCSA